MISDWSYILFSLLILMFFAGPALSYDEPWFRTASRNFHGMTLNGIAENSGISNYIEKNIGKEFHRITGIHIDIEKVPWETMYQKSLRDILHKKSDYDFIYIEQDMIYSYMKNGYLVNISQKLSSHPGLQSPGFNFDDFTTFLNYFKDGSQQIYGIPVEAYLKLYFYREDLFSNQKYRKMYEEKYHSKLSPAKNFEDYRRISEFFTSIGKLEKRPLWGTTFQGGSAFYAAFYEFFETIAPAFGLYHWGIKNNRASVAKGGSMDSEAAIKALEYWINLKKFAPPESDISTWDTTAESMSMGRVAQGMIYGENAIWLATDAMRSKVAGKIKVGLPPTDPASLNNAQSGSGYIGFYDGGSYSIPITSQKAEAALLWLQFLGDRMNQEQKTMKTGAIVHKSTLTSDRIKAFDHKTGGYFSTFLDYEYLFSGAPKFPAHTNIRDIISGYITEAIAGKKTPRAALQQAAIKVDEFFIKN